jgi:hypothetical protein
MIAARGFSTGWMAVSGVAGLRADLGSVMRVASLLRSVGIRLSTKEQRIAALHSVRHAGLRSTFTTARCVRVACSFVSGNTVYRNKVMGPTSQPRPRSPAPIWRLLTAALTTKRSSTFASQCRRRGAIWGTSPLEPSPRSVMAVCAVRERATADQGSPLRVRCWRSPAGPRPRLAATPLLRDRVPRQSG